MLLTPPKFNIDTQHDSIFEKENAFSKAHHICDPFIKFHGRNRCLTWNLLGGSAAGSGTPCQHPLFKNWGLGNLLKRKFWQTATTHPKVSMGLLLPKKRCKMYGKMRNLSTIIRYRSFSLICLCCLLSRFVFRFPGLILYIIRLASRIESYLAFLVAHGTLGAMGARMVSARMAGKNEGSFYLEDHPI